MEDIDEKVEKLIEELDDIRTDFVHWCRVNGYEEGVYLADVLDEIFGTDVEITKR